MAAAVSAPGHRDKRYPTYCPLTVPFDAQRMYRELNALSRMFHTLPTAWLNLENRSKWFDVGDNHLYANVEHVIPDPGDPDKRIFVPGKVPGWRGVSLTHVPGHPETDSGASRFRRKFDGKWVWKKGLNLPYTRQLIENLPFDRLDVVRVMSLPKGGFGPAHVDSNDDSPWEVDGIASISFVLRDGGVPTRLMASDRSLHDVNDPVFFFKDSAPHGIPQTVSPRMMLRVNGAADPERVLALMQPAKAIW
jgi:hypothetical protein